MLWHPYGERLHSISLGRVPPHKCSSLWEEIKQARLGLNLSPSAYFVDAIPTELLSLPDAPTIAVKSAVMASSCCLDLG